MQLRGARGQPGTQYRFVFAILDQKLNLRRLRRDTRRQVSRGVKNRAKTAPLVVPMRINVRLSLMEIRAPPSVRERRRDDFRCWRINGKIIHSLSRDLPTSTNPDRQLVTVPRRNVAQNDASSRNGANGVCLCSRSHRKRARQSERGDAATGTSREMAALCMTFIDASMRAFFRKWLSSLTTQ